MELKYCSMIAFLLLVGSVQAAENQNTRGSQTNHLNYDYLYADLSSGSLREDSDSKNATALAVGVNYLWNDNLLFTLDYSARFIHPADVTTELYTLLPGVAYRFPLADKLDLVAGAKLGYLWGKQSLDSTNEKLFSDNNGSFGASLAVKYAFFSNWELASSIEINRADFVEENLFQIRADYQFAKDFTFGAFYTYRKSEFETVRIKGKTTTSEGGIALRYLF
ncbi:membrane protein [Vibrio tubiashii]|nr:membrane protein [Vibrio tubiashii]